MPWQRAFDDPVPLPNGKTLLTLKEAAAYILKLKKSDQRSAHWQAAAEAVIMAAEDRGPLMHARIGMLRALNHGKPNPDVTPRRKAVKKYRIVR